MYIHYSLRMARWGVLVRGSRDLRLIEGRFTVDLITRAIWLFLFWWVLFWSPYEQESYRRRPYLFWSIFGHRQYVG